jgi:hypothetical protein
MTQQPQSFLGGQPYGVPATPISQPQEVRAVYVTRMTPRLSVRPDGLVCLNAEAARLLPPGDGTIDRDAWHLDCRPGGHYRRLPVGQSGGIRFKAAARTNVMLGVAAEPLHFGLEHVGNGLFRLYTETVNK